MSTIYDPYGHYQGANKFFKLTDLKEVKSSVTNVGWTLGNFCPYSCKHCYSMSARVRGANIESWMVEKIVSQLVSIGVVSVNLGGNEPLFTNGENPRATMLPMIIRELHKNDLRVGLTTSGITVTYLSKEHPEEFGLLNDVDISLDSPHEVEHNLSRGTNIFSNAIRALECAKIAKIPSSIIMCAMNWNFTPRHIVDLVDLAKRYHSNVRINTLKPIEPYHTTLELEPEQFAEGFKLLSLLTDPLEVSESVLAPISELTSAGGCPCGKDSFRIHSITPDGKIPISPCVYLHDFKIGDLLTDDICDLLETPQFKLFRQRYANPEAITGCNDCEHLLSCRGGCAARAYLNLAHRSGNQDFFSRDTLCLKDAGITRNSINVNEEVTLVHKNYLCTWIGRPK